MYGSALLLAGCGELIPGQLLELLRGLFSAVKNYLNRAVQIDGKQRHNALAVHNVTAGKDIHLTRNLGRDIDKIFHIIDGGKMDIKNRFFHVNTPLIFPVSRQTRAKFRKIRRETLYRSREILYNTYCMSRFALCLATVATPLDKPGRFPSLSSS